MTTIATVATGDPIRAADHNTIVALLKGTAGSAEQVALLGNLKLSKGADIASASTLTPGTDGNYFHVTGTVTVTAIASVIASPLILEFDGAVLLTHNATNLILEGGVNYTTAAGDVFIFVSEGAGNWREINRTPQSATYAVPALTLSTTNAAGSAGTGIRSDATVLVFDVTIPAAVGTGATGSATTASRRDHVHPATVTYNFLTNPGFSIWQRGTGAFTTTLAYTADRWQNFLNGTDTNSVSQDTTHTPTNGIYTAACTFVAGNGTTTALRQIIWITTNETAHYGLRGQIVSLSISVRTATASAVKSYIKTDGTGGTTTKSSFHTGGGTHELLTVLNITVPTDATFVEVGVMFSASATVYVGNAILGVSAVAPIFVPLAAADDWGRAQRYYELTDTTANNGVDCSGYSLAGGTLVIHTISFAVKKAIAAPTITKNGTWGVTNCNQPTAGGADTSFRMYVTATAAGYVDFTDNGAGQTVSAEANP